MSAKTRVEPGKRLRVPASRRLTCDLLHFNRHVPQCGHHRRADLSRIAVVRDACPVRISWPALFMKAYAIVAESVPELRQSWHRFPVSHLYEHPHSIGVITVQRQINGEPWLFWGRVLSPENQPLADIQQQIDRYRRDPCEAAFARQLRLARLPLPLRRLTWWWNLNVATTGRARRLGTFFLSTLAGRGVTIQIPPSIHTGCLTYGPLDESRRCRITLAYDHRIMDGVLVADALESLEATLNGRLVTELQTLTAATVSAAAA